MKPPVEKNLPMHSTSDLADKWDTHDFSDQDEGACGCGKESCESESVTA